MWTHRSFVEPVVKDFVLDEFLFLTSMREFHYQSHLALKEALTCIGATFWSFSIIISMTRKVKK